MIKAQINDSDLIKHLDTLSKDEMAIFTMADGRIRGALFHGSRFVNQLRAQHNLGILETMILGQASLCAALMIPTMKGMEHISVKFEGDGPAKGYSVEANSSGYVRGFLMNENIPVLKPLENWNLSEFLGNGTLTVSRLQKGDKQPFTSSVEADTGCIAKDFAWYFRQSEQLSTAFNTGIQFDKKGRVTGAGGLFLQIMPETGGKLNNGANKSSSADIEKDEQLLAKVELAFKTAPSLGQWFSEQGNIENIVYGLFREFNPSIALYRDIIYDCPCSEELFINHVKALPTSEIQSLKQMKEIECVCQNCNSRYRIPTDKIL